MKLLGIFSQTGNDPIINISDAVDVIDFSLVPYPSIREVVDVIDFRILDIVQIREIVDIIDYSTITPFLGDFFTLYVTGTTLTPPTIDTIIWDSTL